MCNIVIIAKINRFMKTSKLLITGLLVLAACKAIAQYKEVKPKSVKYGTVTPEEFQTKAEGADSAAAALVLFDIGKGYFEDSPKGIQFVFERHTRIKIINKNGYDYANFELQFYRSNGGYGTSLNSMDGATYNIENGQIVTSKIGKDAKFSEKQDRNYTLKKFTLPNIREGSIIEYKYRIKSDFIFTLRPWTFQRDIPTRFTEYSLSIPEFYWYHPHTVGFVDIHPQRETGNQNSTYYHYYASNVPGLKNENFVSTMDDYRSRVSFELSSVTVPGRVYEDISSSWVKVVQSVKKQEDFGLFLNKISYSKNLVSTLIKDDKDTSANLMKLFNHVKNNIKWNEDFSFYASVSGPKAVFEKKTGNSADINLTLLTLLKEAHIEAYPVLLSTRSNGTHPGYPMIAAFDNVIVLAKLGQKLIYLDATDKNHTPGIIAYENLSHQGMLINLETETGQWVSLENDKVSQRNITLMLKLDEDSKLSGTAYISSDGYEGLKRRNKYQSATNETEFLKEFKQTKPGLEIKKYQISNVDSPEATLTETMELEIEDNVEEAGNMIFFTPLLFERTKENPFKMEERLFPVDFAYPYEENYRITVEYPEGYVIDKTPKSEKVILPDNKAAFSFMFANEDHKLMVYSKISVKLSLFSAEEYHDLKALFMNVVRKQAEQVVLKKS